MAKKKVWESVKIAPREEKVKLDLDHIKLAILPHLKYPIHNVELGLIIGEETIMVTMALRELLEEGIIEKAPYGHWRLKLKALIYDLEIVKAIPPKNDSERIQDIQYCAGWSDFENMGISVCSYAGICSANQSAWKNPIVFDWENEIEREKFVVALKNAETVAGFNSKSFDDLLLKSNGVSVETKFDILREIRKAAYGSESWEDQPKGYSYKLADIVEANGMKKTGHGEMAPIWWQKGYFDLVRNYCANDAKIERGVMSLLLEGKLKDPNTGELLRADI